MCSWRSRRSHTSEPDTRVAVRDAVVDDAADIAHVRTETWRHAYAHVFGRGRLADLTPEQALDSLRRVIGEPPPRAHVLVVDGDSGVVGFAHLGTNREDASEGELYAIYVLPEAWGRGVGRALMEETLVRLRAEGFREAVLWVLEDNPRTRRFYELAGWQTDGGSKEEEWLGTRVREVRYRISLA